MSDDYQRIELITGTARRRRWTTEQKLRIIEASCEPGESVSSVARRHAVAPNLLYRWRRLMAQGGAAAPQGAGKKTELAARVAAEGRFLMKTVADVLGVARSHLHERVHRPAPPRGHFCKADEELLPLIRRVVDQRPTYGYRRVTALVNRVLTAEGKPAANHKRIFRIMKQQGLLLQRYTGRRKGRLHDGKVVVMRSNLRW